MKIDHLIKISLRVSKLEFKLKNEGTYLGILWYLLHPLIMFPLLLIVFSRNLGQDIINYPAYVLLGIVMFNFFQQTTTESAEIINLYKGFIRSIKFPNKALILAIIFKVLPSHLIEVGLFVILILFTGDPLIGIIFYPIILIFFCIFIFGFSLIIASANVYFSDIGNIWLFGSRFLWIATPIFYSLENNPLLQFVNYFNPLYFFLTLARDVIVYSTTPTLLIVAGVVGYSLVFLVIGLFIFNKLENKFSEKVR